MLKGIYFLETNSSVLSDMEGCFTINDAFVYKGGCGVIREAVGKDAGCQFRSYFRQAD